MRQNRQKKESRHSKQHFYQATERSLDLLVVVLDAVDEESLTLLDSFLRCVRFHRSELLPRFRLDVERLKQRSVVAVE
jgi:hypothetical protein